VEEVVGWLGGLVGWWVGGEWASTYHEQKNPTIPVLYLPVARARVAFSLN